MGGGESSISNPDRHCEIHAIDYEYLHGCNYCKKERIATDKKGKSKLTTKNLNNKNTEQQNNHSKQNIEKSFGYIMSDLMAFGVTFDDESFQNTPARLQKMYTDELLIGYSQNPAKILSKQFKALSSEMIIVKEIPFVSLCAHHWLPFIGVAHVGYIPNVEKQVVGLSKIPRIVNCYARRFQMQENMTSEIADAFEKHVRPAGCIVVTKASHLCAQIRGIQAHGTEMVCSAIRGSFRDNLEEKEEFLKAIKI